jgi:hypothetical protein
MDPFLPPQLPRCPAIARYPGPQPRRPMTGTGSSECGSKERSPISGEKQEA